MRQISLLIILSFIAVCSCDTEGNVDPEYQNYYIKYYGEDGNQDGVDLLVNTDGSMILLGNSSSQTNPVTMPFILKTDPFGTVIWKRQLGELNEKAVDVETDNNGNLIVVSNFGEGDNSRVKIYRIGQNGQGIDSLKIQALGATPVTEKQMAKSVTVTANNTFLIPGSAAPDRDRNNFPNDSFHDVDLADVIILEVDEELENARLISQQGGGEIDGSGIKVFDTGVNGFALFGYTDKPYDNTTFKLRFEVLQLDYFGVPTGPRLISEIPPEVQTASSAIETSELTNVGYLMVGSTYLNQLSSTIYLTRYNKELDVQGIGIKVLLNRRLEGVSAAAGTPDNFFILGNEIRDNNKRDILLLILASDGSVLGSTSFGALEGDDAAGAVRVLPDGRIAVFGTIELETQKKMVLIMLSPDGGFSN